jgi:hypothetical protein
MEGNFSDLEKLKEYIELANSYFGLDKNRKNSRIATHIILDFYKLVLSNVGTIIDERNFEAKSIPNKFLLIRTHIPGFEKSARKNRVCWG